MSREASLRVTVVRVLLAAGVILSFLASLAAGDGSLQDTELRGVFLELRTYRFATAFLAGGALATGGVLVQGLFRNPLASPSLLGTSAGASLGGATVILLWDRFLIGRLPPGLPTELILPFGCLLGALAALTLLLAVTGRNPDVITLLLTGFILSAFFLSIAGLVTSLAQESWELGRAVIAFTLGGVEANGPRHVALALPLVLSGVVAAWAWARPLDVLLAGEEEAASLGVDVRAVRRWIIVWTAVLTAAAVAIGGNVSFVGLVVPHVLRAHLGALHRNLVPAAFIGGGVFVVFADVLVRTIPAQGTIPLGVVTGLIGAPLFLRLLSQRAGLQRLA
ncbi:MAG: iron ABC transporter permease [Myxococcota bacterium]